MPRSETRVARTSADAAVDALAVGVARAMRFSPATRNQRLTRVRADLPIEFPY